ncbi:MAG: hypothetical protein HUU25_05435 [Candidatus Sumerlaeia bacterium]|nr:hypothetical protein [Candidatus Sumerlaeia bacterium]
MHVRVRAKADFMMMLVWLIIIGVIGGVLFTCWSNLKAVNDPANRANYWGENMYTYRSEMEEADRLLEQGRYADARQAYERAMQSSSQNQSSVVLFDRIARSHFREAEALREQGQWSAAAAAYRAAEGAVSRVAGAAANVRDYRSEFQSQITGAEAIENGLVTCLVEEGVVRRDQQQNPDGALSLLSEARRRQPANFRANQELIELHRQRQDSAPLLESMRHFLDNFPGQDSPQFAQMPPEYQQYRQRIEGAHRGLQNHILQTHPVEEWVPMVDGLVLTYHMEYSSEGGGTSQGPPFTRTMRMRDPRTGVIGRDPNAPEYIYSWQDLGGSDYLVEEWTPAITQADPARFVILPRQPQMGAQWRNFDGSQWQIADLVFDPQHQFKLIVSGFQLGPFQFTLGVGRTSGTPLGSYEGERLDSVAYPGAPAPPDAAPATN